MAGCGRTVVVAADWTRSVFHLGTNWRQQVAFVTPFGNKA